MLLKKIKRIFILIIEQCENTHSQNKLNVTIDFDAPIFDKLSHELVQQHSVPARPVNDEAEHC